MMATKGQFQGRYSESIMRHCRVRNAVILLFGAWWMPLGCGKEEVELVTPPPPSVNVVLPISEPVQEFDEFVGRVAAVESVEVRSRVGGYIQSIGFKDGDEVKKDQLLFQIDPRPFQAKLDQSKAELARSQAENRYAKSELERLEPLVEQGNASPQEVSKAEDQVARTEALIAKAEAEITGDQLNLDYASVKSPIDGRISQAQFTLGNLIGGDTLLTTVVSVSPVYVNIDVDERRLLYYREEARRKGTANPVRIRNANLPIYLAMANETDFSHQGVIDFVDNQVDPLTGTIRVRGEVDNSDRFFTPGQFVRVRFPRGDKQESLLVPDRAIGRDQDRKFLLVVNDKDIVEYRQVETGGLFGQDRAILSGIKAGEEVIVDGLQRARPGQPVTPTVISATTQPTTSVN
jgi:RND family efflux transporter MFP subunit